MGKSKKKKSQNKKKILTANWKTNGTLTFEEFQELKGFEVFKGLLLGEVGQEEAFSLLSKSGLQGRGGGGFPLGEKWEMTKEALVKNPLVTVKTRGGLGRQMKNLKERKKDNQTMAQAYFICNADESEPGTYKDRLLLEKNPWLVLEGLLIGAFLTGADQGFVYLNGHYEIAKLTLERALEKLETEKLLGEKILGSDFSFRLQLFVGAGSYVCGEETALIGSIEGRRGEPKDRPPYPTQEGLFSRPTAINNVESLAYVPVLLHQILPVSQKTDKISVQAKIKQTGSNRADNKLFILNGAVQKPGLYEASLGSSIKELLDNYGGGIKTGKKLRVVQVGGSAGKLYGEKDWEKPLGYAQGELPVGSGALLFLDQTADLRKLLYACSHFFRRESCGKCSPCREGTYQLTRLAEDLLQIGKLNKEEKEKLEDLIFTLEHSCFCPLGSSAVNCWESALRLFPEEICGKEKE